MGLQEIIIIGVAVIIIAVVIKIGLKLLKWVLVIAALYAAWWFLMHH